MKTAYFCSHMGLGDHLINLGAVNFLLQYYDTIYFFCTLNNQKNVDLIFNNKRVITISINMYSNEISNDINMVINKIVPYLHNIQDDSDIFVSGDYKSKIKSRITHPELLKYKPDNKGYKLSEDNLDDNILNFYVDIGLDLSIYFDYFDITSTDISMKYYNDIRDYKIVFMHTRASDSTIDLTHIIDKYKYLDDYIIICADKNVYNINDPKYNLADKYVNIPIVYYIDVIKNAEKIHLVSSCFVCITIPLIGKHQINPIEYEVYHRYSYVNINSLKSHINKSFDAANNNNSKLTKEILDLEGIYGTKSKHFYNNLCEYFNLRVLKINVRNESPIMSILHDNYNHLLVINSELDDVDYLNQLKNNTQKWFYNQYCYTTSYNINIYIPQMNVYMYDSNIKTGIYSAINHYIMLEKYYKCLSRMFLFIAEDWNMRDVREGVNNAIHKLKLNILFEREIRTKFDNKPDMAPDTWWNGIYVAILQKTY
jgi:hypothetical protein